MNGAAVKYFAPAALPNCSRIVPVYRTQYNTRVTIIKRGAIQQNGSEDI